MVKMRKAAPEALLTLYLAMAQGFVRKWRAKKSPADAGLVFLLFEKS